MFPAGDWTYQPPDQAAEKRVKGHHGVASAACKGRCDSLGFTKRVRCFVYLSGKVSIPTWHVKGSITLSACCTLYFSKDTGIYFRWLLRELRGPPWGWRKMKRKRRNAALRQSAELQATSAGSLTVVRGISIWCSCCAQSRTIWRETEDGTLK